MTKPLENDGFYADLAATIDFEKLDNVLDAWTDKNEFLKKYDAFRTNKFPLKSREEVEKSIATLNRIVNDSGMCDDDKRTLMDFIQVICLLFDNYGLSFALGFVKRNMAYALDEELERMKAEEHFICAFDSNTEQNNI